jgi:hypothetical protein
MASKANERTAEVIDYSGGDQIVSFNSLIVTTAGTLKFDDAEGNTITMAENVPVGKFEMQGKKIYQTGTTITGIACRY